jgi:ankyrin repeat protein
LIEQGAVIGVRGIKGKTALDIATVKGHNAIIQVLKNRAEGKRLVFSILRIDLNNDSEVGNVEHLHLMNARACAGTERDMNGNYAARMLQTTVEDTLEFHSSTRSAIHTEVVNGNLEEVQ